MSHEITLKKEDLSQFYGTDGYFRWSRLFRQHVLTDGTKHVAEAGQAYWLFDAIASHHPKVMKKAQVDPRLREIQFWELKVKDRSAVLTCRADSGVKPAIRQKIEYTDFPLENIKFMVVPQPLENGETVWVILLPSEN